MMETLEQRVAQARENIRAAALEAGRDPAEVTLVAATKTQTDETIRAAIRAGITVCGENRVQEMNAHLAESAYEGAKLHFIGRLQTNKVKYVVGKVSLIHSVDSLHLAEAIERQADKLGVVQDILLEVNVGGEEAKGGFSPAETQTAAETIAQFPHLRLRGLMAIPPICVAAGGNREFFVKMAQLYVDIRTKINDNVSVINCLSMGMSRDYEDAVRVGATMVRLGTTLFGPRAQKAVPSHKN